MSVYDARLLGRFSINVNDKALTIVQSGKATELLAYLLLHYRQPQHREHLATLLWPECSPHRAKQYLRKALWKLQNSLNEVDTRHRLLVVDNQWIGIENPGSFVLDIASLEDSVHIQKNSTLSSAELTQLIEAAHQYRGSLLEGYYQDWCLIARERYLGLYLMIQDRLMRHYTKTNQYGLGINCGYSILEHDAARERTCRGLMRLYYLAGDRSGAIRQFQYCVNVLQKELAVKPSHKTLRLFALIQEGLPLSAEDTAPPVSPQFLDLLTQLNRLEKTIHSVRAQLHNIQSC